MSFRGLSIAFTGGLFLMMVWALWEAFGWELQASLMAWLIGLPTAALLAAQLAREGAGRADAKPAAEDRPAAGRDDGPGLLDPSLAAREGEPLDPAEERRRTARIIAWILGFAAAIWLLGFQLGIGLASLLYLKFAGERWRAVIGITVAVLAGVVLVFDCGMHIFFAEGKLFVWSGISMSPLFSSFCYRITSPFGG